MVTTRPKVCAIGNSQREHLKMLSDSVEVRVASHVSEHRLWGRLMQLAKIGATESGGVSRFALSEEESLARRLLIEWASDLELEISTDDISNLYFRLNGKNKQAAPVMSGSHIDSQPNGGKFDGTFGVVAALEVLQAIRESGTQPDRSIDAVVWLNEEGSRFSPGMMGSDAFIGRRSLDDCLRIKDSKGVLFAEALETTQSEFQSLPRRSFGEPVCHYVEAHIEQGPLLDAAMIPVGVVTGIQGSRRFRIRVIGEQAHAGTEPMENRKDALFTAVDVIQEIRSQLMNLYPELKLTMGLFEIFPNAPSVVPSSAYFSIDIRHPKDSALAESRRIIGEICDSNKNRCEIEVNQIAVSKSLEFPNSIRQRITRCAEILNISSMPIYSMAGHDARQMHYHCPSGMIFVPCYKGISHSDKEACESSDLFMGTQVLAASLVNMANQQVN
ncbi:MAG: M20 family metallo-hydrolase [Gammaproteobacteria bacterium]|nr:M20 family metallo-hydrolase [Gammaproteobacteria bacterium]